MQWRQRHGDGRISISHLNVLLELVMIYYAGRLTKYEVALMTY